MAAGSERQRRPVSLAGSLRPWRGARRRRALLVSTALVLVLHVVALAWLSVLLRPPSILKDVAPPFYTRTITPEAPAAVAAAAPTVVAITRPNRPSALIKPARNAPENIANKGVPPAPELPASAPPPVVEPPPADDTPESVAQAAGAPASAASSAEPAKAPASAVAAEAAPESENAVAVAAAASAPVAPVLAASATEPAFLANWPADTRLTYELGGNYRGELHGDARVLWQREGTRYHTAVEMSAGLLASLSFTSQGDITASGLRPEVYEENVRGRRRGVHLGDDVRLNNGTRVPRPEAVQDTASQFVELSHRFATGQIRLVPGARVDFSMARPGGIDEWTYDVIGQETLHLPRLGPVPTYHLKPRPLTKPRGPITAEIWYAPSLQYLPVRIKITQGPDTYIDLVVDTIEQR
ncbi:MAG: DUF3108 domain-containing protein [Pseudomonadota bacterium]|nr:DUF3108 domain-containing protein [Pseudomonadota bacterium]